MRELVFTEAANVPREEFEREVEAERSHSGKSVNLGREVRVVAWTRLSRRAARHVFGCLERSAVGEVACPPVAPSRTCGAEGEP